MRLRQATAADVPAMVDLHGRAVREVCAREYAPEQIEAWLGKPRGKRFAESVAAGLMHVCVDDGGAVVGFGKRRGESISALYVDPRHHGQGIGAMLLQRLVEDARAEGLTELTTHSTTNAVTFYERHGFVRLELVDCPVTTQLPLAAWSMRKELVCGGGGVAAPVSEEA